MGPWKKPPAQLGEQVDAPLNKKGENLSLKKI